MPRRLLIVAVPVFVLTMIVGALFSHAQAPDPVAISNETSFVALDIFIDSGENDLAAYQIEYAGGAGTLLVGIEGGEHPAFSSPPAYDPAALHQDRVILAALNTGDDLPTGRTRIARLHLMISGDAQPGHAVTVHTAVDATGREIEFFATASPPEGNE